MAHTKQNEIERLRGWIETIRDLSYGFMEEMTKEEFMELAHELREKADRALNSKDFTITFINKGGGI